MAEPEAPAPAEPTEDQRNAVFAGGYDDAPPPEAPPTQEPEPEPVAEEFVQLTKKDFDRIMAAIPKAETVDAELAKVNGTIGNVKAQFLQRQGVPVKITDEDFVEMREEYPELAGQTKAAFERILSRMGTSGGTGEPATVDPESIKTAVKSELERQLVAEVEAVHPGWIDIIGKPGDAENPYRQWVDKQPEAYRKRLNDSFSPTVIAESLDRFKAAAAAPAPKKPPAQRGADREDRLRAAIPPKGGGAAPAPSLPTRQDAYLDGYNNPG